ncbi:hypothetical protein VIGAN_11062900 [Vigna angularis var. angularis]|uniref:Uncharacterized protein n=1 Tax=Vigna angularis var. angularis TaxID=157739 RepID=A0A0S3T9B7_PHAAN|nr:hypothetical protein VIGAN_11062900 [Vigna angularis var. angularis]
MDSYLKPNELHFEMDVILTCDPIGPHYLLEELWKISPLHHTRQHYVLQLLVLGRLGILLHPTQDHLKTTQKQNFVVLVL